MAPCPCADSLFQYSVRAMHSTLTGKWSCRWRGKTLVPGQTEHAVRAPTSVGYVGSDDVT